MAKPSTSPQGAQPNEPASRRLARTWRSIWTVRERSARLLDAVATANYADAYSLTTQPRSHQGGPKKFRLAQRLTDAAGRLLPWIVNPLRRVLLRPERVALLATSARVLAYGSTVTVFHIRLARSSSPVVLKIFRRSLGKTLPDLLAYAREQQAIVRRIAAWYDGLEILIPTYFVLLRGPLLGIPAVGAVQPFAAGKQRDVFRDLPVSRLVQILRSRRRLREQFLGFVARTLRVAREEQVCVDLLGYRNLVLIDEADGRLLLIDDDSLYDMGDKSTREPAALTELNRRLDYLTAVVRMLQSDGSSSPIDAADLVP